MKECNKEYKYLGKNFKLKKIQAAKILKFFVRFI